jgi:broad specificity phosphatase PhoE
MRPASMPPSRERSRHPARAAAIGLVLALPAPAVAQQALLVVRHAEQVQGATQGGVQGGVQGGMMEGDPVLSEAGQRRADALAAHLKDARITAIYTSQYQRARATAAPLAAALKLQPEVVMKDDIPALANAIRTNHADDVVLVVGHSDTVPAILKTFGATEPVEIGRTEFDNLWLVVPRAGRAPLVSRLRL